MRVIYIGMRIQEVDMVLTVHKNHKPYEGLGEGGGGG